MKRAVQYIIVAVIVALLASAAVWANHCSQLEVCKSVEVVVLNDDSVTFVTPKGVIRELEVNNIYPDGKLVSGLDTDSMERVCLTAATTSKVQSALCRTPTASL